MDSEAVEGRAGRGLLLGGARAGGLGTSRWRGQRESGRKESHGPRWRRKGEVMAGRGVEKDSWPGRLGGPGAEPVMEGSLRSCGVSRPRPCDRSARVQPHRPAQVQSQYLARFQSPLGHFPAG